MSAESERETLLGEAQQILIRSALVEIVENERNPTADGVPFGSEVVLSLARHGAPYRALLQHLRFDAGSAEPSDEYLDTLRSLDSAALRKTAEVLRQRGFDVMRRLTVLPRTTTVARASSSWHVAQAPAMPGQEASPVAGTGTARAARDLVSLEGAASVQQRLVRVRERFFGSTALGAAAPGADELAARQMWEAWFELHDLSAGGVHVATSVLSGLPSFVRTLTVTSGGATSSALAANLRTKPWRTSVRPSFDPYLWSSGDFDEELGEDLARLRLDGLARDRASAFRLDASDVGLLIASNALSPGQRYRVLVPPALGDVALPDAEVDLGAGWRVWELTLPSGVLTPTRIALEALGLSVGTIDIEVDWAGTPPREVRANLRGDRFACFLPGDVPVLHITAPGVEPRSDVVAFLSGPEVATSLPLDTGREWFLALEGLDAGAYAVQAIAAGTDTTAGRMLFAFDATAGTPVAAVARGSLGGMQFALSDDPTASCDLSQCVAGALVLELELPPCWPVELRWRGLRVARPHLLSADVEGRLAADELSPLLERWATERAGDLVLDAGDLGRLTLQHDAPVSEPEIGASVVELLIERRGAVDGLVGDYAALRAIWFDPLSRILGYQLAEFAPGDLPSAASGLAALRLESVTRDGDGALSWLTTPLVLCPRSSDMAARGANTPWGFAAAICRRLGAPRAVLSDGLRWAVAESGRASGWWTDDLGAWPANPDPSVVRAFVRACGA